MLRRRGAKRSLPPVATASLVAGVFAAFAYVQRSHVMITGHYAGQHLAVIRWGLLPAKTGDGESYRLLTHSFVSTSGLQLLLAVASIAILGLQLERQEGPVRVLALFAAASMARGAVAFALMAPSAITWGGSGIAGLGGASLIRALRWDPSAARAPAAFLVFSGVLAAGSAPVLVTVVMAGAGVGAVHGALTSERARGVEAWRTIPFLILVAAASYYAVTRFDPGILAS